MTTYAAACANAATNQGLDPIVAALTSAGIDHAVEQTGGFCMVVTVQLPGEGRYIGITRSEDGDDSAEDPRWLVVHYSDTDCDGTVLRESATTLDAESAVQQLTTPPDCGQCGAVLVLRDPPRGYTDEQRFCGVWWDHPPAPGGLMGHTSGVLDPSPELLAQHAQRQGGTR